MELVTVWDGTVTRDRGLLDHVRGITGKWSAIHETRPPAEPSPVLRYIPKNPRKSNMTLRITEAILAACDQGVSTDEILSATKHTVSRHAIANTLIRLHRRGLVRAFVVRKGMRDNRYWATEFAPEGTR